MSRVRDCRSRSEDVDTATKTSTPGGDTKEQIQEMTVTNMAEAKRCRSLPQLKRIRITPAFFGTPGCSYAPTWPQRTYFMMSIGSKMEHVEDVILEGTSMGQVIPAETLAEAICPNLKRLVAESGIIFDDQHSVDRLAQKLRKNMRLEEFVLKDFENHVTDTHDNEFYLLDPIILALSKIKTLKRIDLSCLASYIPWKSSYISDVALQQLFRLPNLQSLDLSNLRLSDTQFEIIAQHEREKRQLKRLVLNLNYNSIDGLKSIVELIGSSSPLQHLEVQNDILLSENLYWAVMERLESNSALCELKCATREVYHSPGSIDSFLLLNRTGLREDFFDQKASHQRCVEILDQVRSDVNCIYYLLRERPTLCDIYDEDVDTNEQTSDASHCEKATLAIGRNSSIADRPTSAAEDTLKSLTTDVSVICCCSPFFVAGRMVYVT